MIVLTALFFAAMSVPVLGGRLTALAHVRVRGTPALCAALLIQVGVLQLISDRTSAFVAAVLHLFTYGLTGVFLWLNRRIPGLWLLALGGLANALVITANGGVMPSSAAARAAAHISNAQGFSNSDVVADPRLLFLGDVFAWPHPLPLANVFSIGDVLLVVGAGVLLHRLCGSRLPALRAAR